MADNDVPAVYSDIPISNSDEDQFSFTSLAGGVVAHLMSNTKPESFVVGVTGQWGVGKTSMLNLIEEQYKLQRTDQKPVIIISFSLLKDVDRDTMLSDFLLLLTNQVEAESRNSKSIAARVEGKIEKVKKYASTVQIYNDKLNPYFTLLSVLGLDQPEKASNAIKIITESIADRQNPPNLDHLYQEAYDSLLKLKIPIVVLIDDIDRLYPTEIVGLLTLLRSTAQLPYITYFVAYDPSKVEEAIEKEITTSGQDFLDKFVQILVDVPLVNKPKIVSKTVNQIEKIFEQSKNDQHETFEWDSRITTNVIQEYASLGIIKTIRDSTRVLNSVQINSLSGQRFNLFEHFLRSAILQVRIPSFYRWITHIAWKYHPITSDFNMNELTEKESEQLNILLEQYGFNLDHPSTIAGLLSSYPTWEN